MGFVPKATVFSVCVAAILGAFGAVADDAPAPTRLAIDPLTQQYDFGTVQSGALVETEFAVVNRSAVSLQVSRVRATCGCTAGKFLPNVLPPGAEGRLSVTFKTAGRHGRQRKTVYVTFSGMETPVVAGFTLIGTVERAAGQLQPQPPQADRPAAKAAGPVPPAGPARQSHATVVVETPKSAPSSLKVVPAVLYLRNLTPGEQLQTTLRLSSPGGRPFSLHHIRTNVEGLTFDVASGSSPGTCVLTCSFTAPPRPGPIRGIIAADTDLEGLHLTVRVSGNVLSQKEWKP